MFDADAGGKCAHGELEEVGADGGEGGGAPLVSTGTGEFLPPPLDTTFASPCALPCILPRPFCSNLPFPLSGSLLRTSVVFNFTFEVVSNFLTSGFLGLITGELLGELEPAKKGGELMTMSDIDDRMLTE